MFYMHLHRFHDRIMQKLVVNKSSILPDKYNSTTIVTCKMKKYMYYNHFILLYLASHRPA